MLHVSNLDSPGQILSRLYQSLLIQLLFSTTLPAREVNLAWMHVQALQLLHVHPPLQYLALYATDCQ